MGGGAWRLRDPFLAEDAVQEAFLAALTSRESFSGRSVEKTWLVGILKNKVYDHFRKASREKPFTDLKFYGDEESHQFVPDGLKKGGRAHALGPMEWSSEPGASLVSEQFWRVYRRLPKNLSAAFNLREVDGIESREICAMLNINEGNLWVMLHRARMALRVCLESNWFGKAGMVE